MERLISVLDGDAKRAAAAVGQGIILCYCLKTVETRFWKPTGTIL